MVVSTIFPLRLRKTMWNLAGVNQVDICTVPGPANKKSYYDTSVALKNIDALIVLCIIK
jgi:hypothetical protein